MHTIHIARANRGAGTAPVFPAVDEGHIREHGLDPERIYFTDHRSTYLNASRPAAQSAR